jgi:phosphate transport system substrate-binding protein
MAFAVLGLACGALSLAAVPVQAQQITGAGATFPAPVYTAWADSAKAAIGVELNYQAIGSGGGQSQILARTVDFGASDAPMAAEKLTSGNLLQFPTVMGAVVVIANLPGVEVEKLHLSGDVVAAIFAGDIHRWNDRKIEAENPGVKLPNVAISTIHRADGSGTSFVFTSYLSAVSADWKSKVGANTSVNWPVGEGSKGNDGVAASVRATRGGIGYVEYAYAAANHLTPVMLQNKAGKFVAPTMDSFAAAAASADWTGAAHYAVSLIDQPGAASWPIVSATFILLPKDAKDPSRTAAVLKFFDWAYSQGDATARKLDYIPLPQSVKDSVRAAWKSQVHS